MKRKIAAMLVVILFLTGCSGDGSTDLSEPVSSAENLVTDQPETNPTEKTADPEEAAFPGKYTVPDGWLKVDKYSTSEMTFYIEEGHEDDEYPDNISINRGTNRYSAEEHMVFRDTIVQQLLMQLEGADAQLNGDGTYTEQCYVLYIFTIDEEDVTTKQYYIVGDYRFCLVQVTNFSRSESVYEAAQTIVDSFVWEVED